MKALVVIDMQHDFLSGALGSKEAQAVVAPLAEKLKQFDGLVLFTADIHDDESYLISQEGRLLPQKHCIRGTEGQQIHPQLFSAAPDSVVFEKGTFGSRELAEYLAKQEGLEEVILTGVCTDICVISNAILLKAFLPEVRVSVDAACCAGTTPENHNNALRAMRQCQIFVDNWTE